MIIAKIYRLVLIASTCELGQIEGFWVFW